MRELLRQEHVLGIDSASCQKLLGIPLVELQNQVDTLYRATFPPGIDQFELERIEAGPLAAQLGRDVFQRHFEQLQEVGRGAIEASVYQPNQIDGIITFKHTQQRYYSFWERKAALEEGRSVKLPVTVVDRLHCVLSQDQGLTIFIDHTDCVMATAELYQAIKNEELDPYRVLIKLLADLSYSGEEMHNLVKTHARLATSFGLELDAEKFIRQYPGYPYYGKRIHCYAAGIKTKGFIPFVEESFAMMSHSSGKDSQELLFAYLRQLDEQSLIALLNIDVAPFQVLNWDQFALDVSRVLLHRLTTLDLQPEYFDNLREIDRCLPSFPQEAAITFIFHALQKHAHLSRHRDVDLSVVPSLGLHNSLLLSAVIDFALIFNDDLESCHQVIELLAKFIADEQQLAKLHEIIDLYIRLNKLELGEERVASVAAASFMKLGAVEKALDPLNREQLWPAPRLETELSLVPLASELIGSRFATPYVARTPFFPQTSLERVYPDYGYRRWRRDTVRASALQLASEKDIKMYRETDPFIFQQVANYCQDPWVVRQFRREEIDLLKDFFLYLNAEIETMGDAGLAYGKDQINSFLLRAVDDRWLGIPGFLLLLARFTHTLALSYRFAGLADVLTSFEIPLFNSQLNLDAEPALAVESPYYPFDLLTLKVTQMDRLERRIAIYLEKKEDDEYSSNYRHIGMRLAALLENNRGYACHDYVYPPGKHEAERVDWPVSNATRLVASRFWGQLPSVQTTPDKRKEQGFHQELGREFCRWIRIESLELWEQYNFSMEIAGRREAIGQIRDYYQALYEIYSLTGTSKYGHFCYSCGKGMFDDVVSLSKRIHELIALRESPITPYSPLSVSVSSPVVLMGGHEAGKSSLLRLLACSTLLSRHHLLQPGQVSIGGMLSLESAAGFEHQLLRGGSLFTQMIPALNRMAQGKAEDNSFLWMVDELGRRTNRSYGLAIFLTSMIIAHKNNNLLVGATHYHDMFDYASFLQRMGISPNYRLVEDYDHRPVDAQERELLQSEAIRTLAAVIPQSLLRDWPCEADKEILAGLPQAKPLEPLTLTSLLSLLKEDLVAGTDERIEALATCFDFDKRTARVMDERFFDLVNSTDKQALIGSLIAEPEINEYLETVNLIISIQDCVLEMHRARSAYARKGLLKYYCEVFAIKLKPGDDGFKQELDQALAGLQAKFDLAVSHLRDLQREHCPGLVRFDDIPANLVINIEKRYASIDELNLIQGVLTFAQMARRNNYARVEFTSEPRLEVSQAINPLLANPVPVDIDLDFADGSTGLVATGENGSGKSNYLTTMAWMFFLVLSCVYVPAEAATLDEKIFPLSLNQTACNTLSKSSMRMEVENRIRRVIQAIALARRVDIHILTLLDEPGAPTSPEDASKLIQWLVGKYQQEERAYLAITTHCDHVEELLGDAVRYLAFQLLSEPRYIPREGVGDSNALEVAKEFHLDELFYQVASVVYNMIKQVDQLKAERDDWRQSEELERIFQRGAQRVQELL